VEELLDFSRMQNGRMVFNMEKMDVLAELGEAVYTFKERALREEKYLLYDEPETISPIRGDANRLRQVFINIIDNAMKYTQKGGTVRVTISELYTNVHVVISDNGTGIPAEHLPNVKRKFYKANQQVRGSGIGLAVSDEIVQVHGGLLEVESTEGEGTAVTITLPVLPKEVEKD
jgi:signal transduction histidine kinase